MLHIPARTSTGAVHGLLTPDGNGLAICNRAAGRNAAACPGSLQSVRWTAPGVAGLTAASSHTGTARGASEMAFVPQRGAVAILALICAIAGLPAAVPVMAQPAPRAALTGSLRESLIETSRRECIAVADQHEPTMAQSEIGRREREEASLVLYRYCMDETQAAAEDVAEGIDAGKYAISRSAECMTWRDRNGLNEFDGMAVAVRFDACVRRASR